MGAPPVIDRAESFADRIAVVDIAGAHSYHALYTQSLQVTARILSLPGSGGKARIALLLPPDARFVAALWGVWWAGGIAVPLCISHPPTEWEHVLDDATPSLIIAEGTLAEAIAPSASARGIPLLSADDISSPSFPTVLPDVAVHDPALIIYTSGTTGKPKGAVLDHANLAAQMSSLSAAWGWSAGDRILNVLPLHHVHGIVNIVGCALWNGAAVEMAPKFDAAMVWERIASDELTLFMAVPTIYAKLIAHWDMQDEPTRAHWSAACRRMRLFVSGSAALPIPLFERWREVSGHELLERYGMTEIGMALSNPLDGERRPGYVGQPLPGVEVRLAVEGEGPEGEIQVRGPGVFTGYWNRPQATAETFTADGWFHTGDIAVVENGSYRILGRASSDIIKTGGFKVSALEIEQALLRHPAILEVAVVGLPDPVWGERVAAAIVEKPGSDITPGWLRGWARQFIAEYKLPTRLIKLSALPRNVMGKVDKKAVVRVFAAEETKD